MQSGKKAFFQVPEGRPARRVCGEPSVTRDGHDPKAGYASEFLGVRRQEVQVMLQGRPKGLQVRDPAGPSGAVLDLVDGHGAEVPVVISRQEGLQPRLSPQVPDQG